MVTTQNTVGNNNAITAQSSADITRQLIVFAIIQEATNHIINELIKLNSNKSIKQKGVCHSFLQKTKIFSKEIHYIYVQQIGHNTGLLQELQPNLLKKHLIQSFLRI